MIGLVACSAAKLSHPAPAGELYRSALFVKSRSFVQRHADRWFVLSALHGLLPPQQVVAPYDVRLPLGSSPVQVWADRVAGQLRDALAGVPDPGLLVLAGRRYRCVLALVPDVPAVVPLAGLGIGQQLGWLTSRAGCGGAPCRCLDVNPSRQLVARVPPGG